ncbi:MAG TPA: radical SAM protein [Caldisericia bacterium]|nr:radical SAM protein [Caldisericia bacterium]
MIKEINKEIEKRNNALKYLGKTLKGKERFIFSKLGNELTLITTKLCNLNCPFCYDKANIQDKKSLKKLNKELNSEEIKRLINVCKRIGVNSIRLTGGEALLKNGFFDILNACKDMEVSLCSNGLILEKNLNKIVKVHPEKLHIHLSLEGIDAHKKYRRGSDPYKIIKLASKIKKTYPFVKVSINTVISEDNVYELIKTYKLLRHTKIDRWTISFPRLVKNALEKNFRVPNIKTLCQESNKLLRLYEKDRKPFNMTISYIYKYELHKKENYTPPNLELNQHPCLPNCNGARGLIIDSFGNVLDCLTLKPFLKKPVNIKKLLSKKNITTEQFISFLYKSIRSKFYRLKFIERKECVNCRYLKICKGGCPANAYYLSKDLNEVDIISCLLFFNFEKEILPNLIKEDAKIYQELIDKTKSINIIKNRIQNKKEDLIKIGCFS